ncbi:MAG: 6-carboxytetrahydropterin synthase QueD [Deltaproteobacteria bacterium]|nr:MAG: 6-carboxytetrahydropterin synthase QueD [Deltaproteobacteria bacterium]
MYRIKVIRTFAAAHHLRNYNGKCENTHGHNYRVEVEVEADRLDGAGLAVDFGVVKARLDEVLDYLDHCDLNALPEFTERNPSAENIARVVYEKLKGAFSGEGTRLAAVSVWESDTSCATYTP